MSLDGAHEGYEYQDLLTGYFILNEILNETECEFIIDRKEFDDDKLDDLIITNKKGRFKKQIKYSGDKTNHTFVKANVAANSSYNLSLDGLYQSWLSHSEKNNTEFRLCLAWNEPVDELQNVLVLLDGYQTFPNFSTKVYKIRGQSIWPENKSPLSTWRQFKKASIAIERESFLEFCDQLLIEVGLPKFSLNLNSPGDLEKLVLAQARQIGVGVFPNTHHTPETFVLFLLLIIKRARSKGTKITIASIFHELNINIEYGKIEQNFPVNENENIHREDSIEEFISEATGSEKLMLLGEPGSGKSWFIENLQDKLEHKGIKVIKHYCYTHLDDILQHERIKLNTFYGNLIYDIIEAFPDLKDLKKEKYASNLNELNILLENIKKPTFLIIDGLDHIERIFNFRKLTNLTIDEIAIIEYIQKLSFSSNVKVIVASQNISQLEKFEDFKKIFIPPWNETDIKDLLSKLKIENRILKQETSLSLFLLNKSAGNPLYIKHLIDEITRNPKNIDQLPEYSFNLEKYYKYLLSQLNTNADVPQVLSGVSFSLTKTELEEITGSGAYVAESLNILFPVLKLNLSQSGYMIYHESFRRFMIDYLKSKSISIEKKVFQPIIEWFETKDFFSYNKAYRYNLAFLYESGEFEKMLTHLKYTFVTDSVINGKPWKLIVENYKYFVQAACELRDFPNIILLNEINKILSTTEDNLKEIFSLYIEALGKVYGFVYVSEYLIFDGNPSFSLVEGLKACYICDENNVAAPWEIYLEHLKEAKEIDNESFGFAVRGLLALKKENKLNSIAGKLLADNKQDDFVKILNREICKYNDKDFTTYLINKYQNIQAVVNAKPLITSPSRSDLLLMAEEILAFEHVYSRQAPIVENFISGIVFYKTDRQLFEELINKFKGKNWFYNWLIYYLKIVLLAPVENPSYFLIKEAFDYLQYTTEPFYGKPRTCDLYPIHHVIYKSFQEGLGLINSSEQWNAIIDILVKVSNGITTSIQKSQSGPLTTDALFQLFSQFASKDNLSYINNVFEKLYKEKQEYHLHTDVAEYNFRLASLLSAANEKVKAENYFKIGVEYSLAYTMRKDGTLDDVVRGIEFFSAIDPVKAFEDLKKIKILADSVVDHTDGKGTQYYPIMWFESFLKIDFQKAALYLLHELSNSRYDWRAENSLIDLLCVANGKIDPVTEFYLSSTFPVSDSEKFITYCLSLYEILKDENSIYAEKLLAKIIPSVQPKKDRRFSNKLVESYNEKLKIAGYDRRFVIQKEKKDKDPAIVWYKAIIDRKEFSSMSESELTAYFEENSIIQNDVFSVSYLFRQYHELTESLKQLIKLIVSKNSRNYPDKADIDSIFTNADDIESFYWVCRFVYDVGGWFEKFVNHRAFYKAVAINSGKALKYLFELLPSLLEVRFNSEFSSNLIKVLVDAGYDEKKIELMWKNLMEITSYRLPSQDEINWGEILYDKFEMDTEEVLICILICRFKAATTERFQWVTSALKYLFDYKQDKLLKPLKWFFHNHSKFLDSAFIIVLQLLLEQKEKSNSFYLNFQNELKKISSKRYFLIEFLLHKLIEKPLPILTVPKSFIYPDLKNTEYDFLFGLNKRFKPMADCGIEVEKVFDKYMATFRNIYESYFELYWNRAYKTGVLHIFSSNYLLELINVDLFNELKVWCGRENEMIFKYTICIDVDSIFAQINSLNLRPFDLDKPYEFQMPYEIINDFNKADWIRIGHYEAALKDEGGLRSRQFKSFGGVVFSDDVTDSTIFPYSDYSIFPFHIWGNLKPQFELDKAIVFRMIQEDALEFYNILWLNPTVVSLLGLAVKNTDTGLIAINSSNETIIKMRTWSDDYIGDGYRTSLADQIPRLQGTDLTIRKDYFDEVCKYFDDAPSYRVIKREWSVIKDLEDRKGIL